MKRIIISALGAAAAAITLAGCMKMESKDPNGVYYGNYLYYLTRASFTPGEEGGINVIELDYGSKADFENPENLTALYNKLCLYFTGDVSQGWAGEFELASMSANRLECGSKYLNTNTGEYASNLVTIEILSGTLTIESLSGGSWKLSMEGTSADLYPISLVYEGTAVIQEPEQGGNEPEEGE